MLHNIHMDVLDAVGIVAAERLNDGLVIRFSDGKCAFYATVLLYAMFVQADKLDETATPW